MDAVEYLRAFYKMCDSNTLCDSCEAYGICENDYHKAERMVEIVEKWEKEHPPKTRQSEFLKMFPSAHVSIGIINIRPCDVDMKVSKECTNFTSCWTCRREYWREEIE